MAPLDETIGAAEIAPHRGDILGEGTFGYIEDLGDYRLPGQQEALVFKRFKGNVPHIATASLRQIPHVRAGLSDEWRRRWDVTTVWPLRVVTDRKDPHRARGILMKRIPPDYFFTMRLPSGTTKQRARDLEYAVIGKDSCRAYGVEYLSHDERIDLLKKLAYTLAMLHSASVVYGDLSFGNVVYRRKPAGGVSIVLVDCDSAVPLGTVSPFRRQAHTTSFTPPEKLLEASALKTAAARGAAQHELKRLEYNAARQDFQTDAYKFGLIALRVLDHGDDKVAAFDPTNASRRFGGDLGRMLEASLAGAHGSRPSLDAWYRALGGTGTTDTRTAPGDPLASATVRSGGDPIVANGHRWEWDAVRRSWVQRS